MTDEKHRNLEDRQWQRMPSRTRISANAPGSERRTAGSQRRARHQLQAGDIAATRAPGGQLS